MTEALSPAFRWRLPTRPVVSAELAAAGAARGLSSRLITVLAARGHASARDLDAFFGDPSEGLHDPALLPDADRAVARLQAAAAAGERVMVFGDFDADGLTGLTILVTALRCLGADATPYVPSRLDEGHGLSAAAVARAEADGQTLIVTVDCGTASAPEIATAAAAGIGVIVTEPPRRPGAAAGRRGRQPAPTRQPLPGSPAGGQRRRIQARATAAAGPPRRPGAGA
ncbi:MAG: hypothetical protein H0W07_09545 [Chloroflexi bacterium]|nr:hypothetical protein [Chloroflexota bacterium]